MSRKSPWNNVALLAAAMASVAILWSSPAYSKMYKWVDENGKIHYTNNPSKIPRKYRKDGAGVKTMKSTRPPSGPVSSGMPGLDSRPSSRPSPVLGSPSSALQGEYRYDLEDAGNNHYFVTIQINSNVQAKLLLDTGASMVVLHPSIAGELGINIEKQPMVAVGTAGGVQQNPLVVLDEVRVGHIPAYDVVATLNPHMKEHGLLGMTFLSNFKWSVDNHRKQLVLEPMIYPGDTLYGDKPLSWWKERYKKYVTEVNRANFQLAKSNPNRQQTLQLKLRSLFYKDLIARLDRRADAAGLPEKYRDPFAGDSDTMGSD